MHDGVHDLSQSSVLTKDLKLYLSTRYPPSVVAVPYQYLRRRRKVDAGGFRHLS